MHEDHSRLDCLQKPWLQWLTEIGHAGYHQVGTKIIDLPVPRKLKVYPKGSACPGNWVGPVWFPSKRRW